MTAHELNPAFHASMKEIFQGFDGIEYRAGPVKTRQRCQAKSETDYADRDFPTVANITDFIRCTFVCKSPKVALDAMETFLQKVNSGKYPFKKILRFVPNQ